MDFKTDRPIFRQIADFCCSAILADQWTPGERIPSVRELGATLAVNAHTVLKAYEHLESYDIINSRRGMGYFLAADAKERIVASRRAEFFDVTLAEMFSDMKLLGISIDEIVEKYQSFQN